MIGKYFSSAARGIVSARTRAVLAILGIMTGIFLIVILLGIGVGVEKHIVNRLTDLGPEVVVVTSADKEESADSDSSLFSTVNTLNSSNFGLDDVDSIKKLQDIKAVAPIQYFPGKVYYKSRSSPPSTIIASTTADYEKIRQLEFESGRFFKESEQNDSIVKVVLGSKVKESLFGESEAIGETIKYDGRNLQVVGVLKNVQASNDALGADAVNSSVYASTSIQTNPKLASTYSLIQVRADGINNVVELKDQITKSLSSYRDNSSFKVIASEDLIKQSTNMLDVLSALITVLAVISLFMSGIGIMNMMIVSVTDRTKEIGVRKTVGATSSNIFWQFLIEAVLLTLLGGILGIAFAVSAAYAMGKILPFEPVIGLNQVLIGAILSIFVGIVFGVGPAVKAARKEPIEALHTDHT